MQALSPEESAVVRLHLAECAFCRAELADVTEALALVALSCEQHLVPEGARQRFIDKISASPTEVRPAAPAPVSSITSGRRPSRPSVWIPWAAVAALAILVISFGMKIISLNRELRSESDLVTNLGATTSHAEQVLEILTAPTAQRVVLTPGKMPTVPTGCAVYLADRGGLIFEANNLEHLPEDKTYELWMIPANGNAPVPAGLFRPDATGSASVVLPPLPKGLPAKAFAVTIEKAAGSAAPTTPIILSGAAAITSG